MTDTQLQLLDAHEREAERKNAEFVNLGWYISDDRIESKTTNGVLVTRHNGRRIWHEWVKQ